MQHLAQVQQVKKCKISTSVVHRILLCTKDGEMSSTSDERRRHLNLHLHHKDTEANTEEKRKEDDDFSRFHKESFSQYSIKK